MRAGRRAQAPRKKARGVLGRGNAVVEGRGADFGRAEGVEVVAVENETSVLKVDDGVEGSGVEVKIGFGMILRGKRDETCIEMAFKCVDRGRAYG